MGYRSSNKTESWAYLYSDGAVRVDSGDVAIGGVIRDNKGRCVHKLLQEVGHWKLEYIPREENLATDSITNMAFVKNE
ncbi:hypothetical protein J1N35_000450, partial [Gossypium stocksii]